MILFFSFIIVAMDLFYLCGQNPWLRLLPSFAFFLFLGFYYKIFPYEYGFHAKIQPSLKYWCKASLCIGAIILAFCLLSFLVFKMFDIPIPKFSFQNTAQWKRWMFFACLISPIVEEILYRSVLCCSLEKAVGTNSSIVISGAVFALLHFFYGNLAIDNFIAGYFLAWAFLKSKSILIPILLHAAGNAFVGLYYMP